MSINMCTCWVQTWPKQHSVWYFHVWVDQEQQVSSSQFLSRLRIATMRTTHLPSLADVAADAAAGAIITDYLTARGVRTVPTLAFIAKTEEELDRHRMQPLFAGYTQGTQRFEVPTQEQPIVQAIMLHMWNTGSTTSSSISTCYVDHGGIYFEARGEGAETAAHKTGALCFRTRTRPSSMGSIGASLSNEILGVEVILARMWHEHQTSRMYSPVLLGDIIQRRSFTASGDIKSAFFEGEIFQDIDTGTRMRQPPGLQEACSPPLTAFRRPSMPWSSSSGAPRHPSRSSSLGWSRGPVAAPTRWSTSTSTSPPSLGSFAWAWGRASLSSGQIHRVHVQRP